jgi:hypothetical protein
MNPILKSRDYHRSYQKWDALLLEGKVDEIIITTLKEKPKSNAARVLQTLERLPMGTSTLQDIRGDYDSEYRL